MINFCLISLKLSAIILIDHIPDIIELSTLPSKIAFTTITIESPKGKNISIPRRELFDIRMQLMAEDEPEGESLIENLDKSDLRTNVYEGGFKTWECSLDLARLLLDRGPRKDLDDLCRVDHVIEVSYLDNSSMLDGIDR